MDIGVSGKSSSHPSMISGDHTEEITLIIRCENGERARGAESDSVCSEHNQDADNVTRTPLVLRGKATTHNVTADGKSTPCNNGSLRTEAAALCRNNRRTVHEQTRTSVHEKAIDTAGFGEFQWRFFVVLAMALMVDGSEMAKMSYVIDGAEKAFCMTHAMKTSLVGAVPVGMLLGSLSLGLSADGVGRKRALCVSLCFHVTFGALAAMMPYQALFFVWTFLSAVGAGGVVPIALAYFGEFCPLRGRGRKVGALLVFQLGGAVLAAGLAWLLIHDRACLRCGQTMWTDWRVFLLLCLLPPSACLLGLLAMPDSPRFLLQASREMEALKVYRSIYVWNHREDKTEHEMAEIVLPNDDAINDDRPQTSAAHMAHIRASLSQLFNQPLAKVTRVLCLLWLIVSFGCYGITEWTTGYHMQLKHTAYVARTTIIANQSYSFKTFTSELILASYENCTFDNVSFKNIEFRHLRFYQCRFERCKFENVDATNISFTETNIARSVFSRTDLCDLDFRGSTVKNSTFMHNRSRCATESEPNTDGGKLALENCLSKMAALPAAGVYVLAVDQIGRSKLLATSLFMSAIGLLPLWFGATELFLVCMAAVVHALSFGALVCLMLASMELYPTRLRCTGLGLVVSVGRLAAILGDVVFSSLVSVDKTVALLVAIVTITIASFIAVKLPESKGERL